MWATTTTRLATTLLAAATLGGCWIQPGYGPTRQGYSPVDGGTNTATVAELEPTWRATTGEGANRPIVVGDRVVVTWRNKVRAFAMSDGTPEWSRELTDEGAPPDVIPYLGDPVSPYDGTIQVAGLIQRFGIAYVLDAETGEGDGQFGSGVPIGAPAVTPDITVRASAAVSSGGTLATLGYPGGPGLLYFGGPGLSTSITDPMVHRDRVWIGVGRNVLRFDFGLCVPAPPPIPAFLGCIAAKSIAAEATVNTPGATDRDEIVVTDRGGGLRVVDAGSATVRWTANLGAELTAPAIAPGRILVGSGSGEVVAMRSGGCGSATCEPLWRGATGSRVTTQPAVAGGVVYVGTAAGQVLAFATKGCGARECAPLWVADATTGTPSGVRSGPILAAGRVIVVLDNGDVVTFARP